MKTINHYKLGVIDSTQIVAKREILTLSPKHWHMWSARGMTAGQGTNGRCWFSPVDTNMYVTYGFFLPKATNLEIACISQVAGYSVIQILEKFGIANTALKWPNDVLVNQKKISGVLAEVLQYDNNTNALVLGVAININSTETDLSIIDQPATSMHALTGNTYNISEIIDIFSQYLICNVEKLILSGFAQMQSKINDKLYTFNKSTVILRNEFGYYSGTIEGVGMKGELLLANCRERSHYNGHILKGQELKEYISKEAQTKSL